MHSGCLILSSIKCQNISLRSIIIPTAYSDLYVLSKENQPKNEAETQEWSRNPNLQGYKLAFTDPVPFCSDFTKLWDDKNHHFPSLTGDPQGNSVSLLKSLNSAEPSTCCQQRRSRPRVVSWGWLGGLGRARWHRPPHLASHLHLTQDLVFLVCNATFGALYEPSTWC